MSLDKIPYYVKRHNVSMLSKLYKDNKGTVKLVDAVNVIDNNGVTPLWRAVYQYSVDALKKDKDIIRILLLSGADPNFMDGQLGKTILGLAIETGDLSLAEILLRYKADPNADTTSYEYDDEPLTYLPIDLAIELDNRDMAKLLYIYGAGATDDNLLYMDPRNKLGWPVDTSFMRPSRQRPFNITLKRN